jgi:hypothetical protein
VSRRIESLDRSAAAEIFPRQANGAPVGSGAAIGGDDCRAADAQTLRQLPLGRHAGARWNLAARDRPLEKADEMAVERTRRAHELLLDRRHAGFTR